MRRLTLPTLLLLSACGQAGDLYLPGEPEPPPPAAEPAGAEALPAGTDEKKKEAQ